CTRHRVSGPQFALSGAACRHRTAPHAGTGPNRADFRRRSARLAGDFGAHGRSGRPGRRAHPPDETAQQGERRFGETAEQAEQSRFRQERPARRRSQGSTAALRVAHGNPAIVGSDRAGSRTQGPMNATQAEIDAVIAQINRVILGKDPQIRMCLACLLARGHLLIEDIPGVGKTTLAHALAKTLGLSFQRVQFTSDLLPADVLGVSIYDRETGKFRFQRGPIFAQLVLADEINQAPPKAQSALLEAMEEHQVTLDGQSMPLPEPFFVIATQNPQDQVGTFPLPESQLDRFLMRVHLGYPAAAAERELLSGVDRRDLVNSLSTVATVDSLRRLQQSVLDVHVSPALLDYVQALVAHTRRSSGLNVGLSPRAAIGLLRAARAWALISGRDALIPGQMPPVFAAVVEHRVRAR